MSAKLKPAEQQQPDLKSLPLFYNKPVAVDKNVHADMSLVEKLNFDFAAKVNAVPITMIEMPQIMQFYPIVFSATSPATPLAILGMRDNENMFINDKGEWKADTFIPAYIRRYPFIFARNDEGTQLTLCIDDAEGILKTGTDNALFDDKGNLTPLTQNALEYCRSYQAAAEQTEEFAKAMDASGLLIERQAEVKFNDGNVATLRGFRQVDEQKLQALSESTILDWHRKNWLGFVYAHLFSSANWGKLFQMAGEKHEVSGK